MVDTGGRKLGLIITVVGILCAVMGAYLWLRSTPPQPAPQDSHQPAPPPHPLQPQPPDHPPQPPQPLPSPTAPTYPLGSFLSEADFATTLQKTGAAYIVIAVSDPDSTASLQQTTELLALLADWRQRHIEMIGITTGETEVDAARFIRQSGKPQQFAVYRAPWFAGKFNLTGTPTLYLFDKDGHPLHKASPGAEPVLTQIQRRVDELLSSSIDPLLNPQAANDPLAQEDFWTKQQVNEGVKLLPGLAAALAPIQNDLPGQGDTVEQLTARYRPALKKTTAVSAWVYKGWPGKPEEHWAKITLTDDDSTRYGPPGKSVGRAIMVDHIDTQPANVQLQVYWDRERQEPLLWVFFDLVSAPPTGEAQDTPATARARARVQLWLKLPAPPPAIVLNKWAAEMP